MKILHTADIHFSRENQVPALKSLNYFYEYGESQGVDLWVIAGDLFDRAVQNTSSSGFPQLVEVLQKMMNIAPIVAVKGTPTHDIDGCYEALQEINAEYSFTLLHPEARCLLTADGVILSAEGCEPGARWSEDDKLLIMGCPEPSKEWFLRDKQLGKDESTQAIIEGMRQMLLGWGAIRREYPEIPCLFVYHGNVVGATLQNNQILPAGDIAIGRDDLALVGADYYALGHIHLAQQIGGLEAYYAGSVFPITWGETDQKIFHEKILGLTGGDLLCVPFPHPRRKKIERAFGHGIREEDVDGFQTWLEIKATKTQAAIVSKDSLMTELLSQGALEGSRVTVSVLSTETVRAGNIAEAHKLRDKIGIYADNSGAAASEAVLEMADGLEAAAREQGLTGEGLHIRSQKLIVRGSIAIHKGLGLDEIEIDLEKYDPGLITLIGDNGSGKTGGIFENFQPFPGMMTRSGKLQDHFRLRDSYRDYYFIDERTGNQYRTFIQIDGKNPTGSVEYHLYKNGEPITNGRKEDYVEKITDLFGSLSLYLRSAFITQKPPKDHPDLSEATKGEKKALFGELGGLDYLQTYADEAKFQAKDREEVIVQDQAKVETLTELVESGSAKEDEFAEQFLVLREKEEALIEIKADGEDLKVSEALLRAKVEENNRVRDRCHEIRNQLQKLMNERDQIEDTAATYTAALQRKPEVEKTIAVRERLEVKEGELNAERTGILEERERLNIEHRDATKIVADAALWLAGQEAEKQAEISAQETTKAETVAKIDQMESFIAKKIKCPECGNEFAPDEDEYRGYITEHQKTIWEIDKELAELGTLLKGIQEKRAGLVYPKDPDLPGLTEVGKNLYDIKQKISFQADPKQARDMLAKAQEAEVRIEEGAKRMVAIVLDETGFNYELKEAEERYDPDIEAVHDEAAMDLEESRDHWRSCNDEVIRLQTEVKNLEKQIEQLGAKRKELEEIQVAIAAKQCQIFDWRYLERACGPDGIQALELDAMGPGIAEVANRLLAAAYGNRFQIEFRTTRIGGSGSKKKQIEDFQIVVFDSEDGGEQLLETLSGGESVWIKRAIYDSFGIIRDRNTGQRFLTAMQDEADGALDADARVAYFRMLEAAHLESGRHHTIVITHSQEAQEMVPQRIVMSELGGKS